MSSSQATIEREKPLANLIHSDLVHFDQIQNKREIPEGTHIRERKMNLAIQTPFTFCQ